MTRAGEKLYGDWERRFDPSPPRRPRWPWIVAAIGAAAIVAFLALR